MDVDEEIRMPDGTEQGGMPVLSRAEERTLARESTVSFAGMSFPLLVLLDMLEQPGCTCRLGDIPVPTNSRLV